MINIFLVTDNVWWFRKATSIFNCHKDLYNVTYFCSKSSSNLFENELNDKSIRILNIKEQVQYLIDNFHLGISTHCKQIFPSKLVETLRCINIHPGLNPYNRGWYPQVFSIINKKPVGATIHIMDSEVDHGNILSQKEVKIDEWDTSKDVYDRVLKVEHELFVKNLHEIINGNIEEQVMHNEGNYNSINDYKDRLMIDLDEKLSMREAIDYLRAMTHAPYKNAYFLTENNEKVFVSLNIEKE